MKIAIKTVKGRDRNGNTTYTATCQGKRFKQQKILSLDDLTNHLSVANQLREKLQLETVLKGAVYDDKTMFFVSI